MEINRERIMVHRVPADVNSVKSQLMIHEAYDNPKQLWLTDFDPKEDNSIWLPQYLYFIDDSKIKGKGYRLDLDRNSVGVIDSDTYYNENGNFRKIIASTNPELGLPIPTDKFVESYCKKGGISEVLMDYEYYTFLDGVERIYINAKGEFKFNKVDIGLNSSDILKELGLKQKYPYYSIEEENVLVLSRNMGQINGTCLSRLWSSFSIGTNDFNQPYEIEVSQAQKDTLSKLDITPNKEFTGFDINNYKKPKVNSYNEVTIHSIKNSWNKEEINMEMNRLLRDVLTFGKSPKLLQYPNSNNIAEYIVKWQEENL